MRFALFCLVPALLLAGCGLIEIDRLDVQQGNRLEPAEVRAVRVGMSRAEVRGLLGTPVLATPFHADRWDYVYYEAEAGTPLEDPPRRLTIHFQGDAVSRIDDRYAADAEGEG